MKLPTKFWLPAVWIAALVCALFMGPNVVLAWILRFLTLCVVVWISVVLVNFMRARIGAIKHGQPIWTESTVRWLLFGVLGIGLVLRIVGWNHGHPGVAAWIGGIAMLVSIAGFIVLQFFVERAKRKGPSFYFNPYWKYGLILLCIVTFSIQGLARPTGIASTLNVALFWIALLTLFVQAVGRWMQRRHGDGSGRPTRPVA